MAFANEKIGWGHLLRCSILAEELRSRWNAEIFFISNVSEHDIPKDMEVKGCLYPPKPQIIKGILSQIIPNFIFYDYLELDESFLNSSKYAASKTIVFDYYKAGANLRSADFVFNFHIDNKMTNEVHGRFFQGMQYAILSNDFYVQSTPSSQTDEGFKDVKILVTFGQTDPHGLAEKFLNSFLKIQDELKMPVEIQVVLGKNPLAKEIIEKFGKLRTVNFLNEVENMATLMKSCDLTVVSGGVTLYEAAQLNRPSLVLCAHAYAFELASQMNSKGLVVNLGMHNDHTTESLSKSLLESIKIDRIRAMRKNLLNVSVCGRFLIPEILENRRKS